MCFSVPTVRDDFVYQKVPHVLCTKRPTSTFETRKARRIPLPSQAMRTVFLAFNLLRCASEWLRKWNDIYCSTTKTQLQLTCQRALNTFYKTYLFLVYLLDRPGHLVLMDVGLGISITEDSSPGLLICNKVTLYNEAYS